MPEGDDGGLGRTHTPLAGKVIDGRYRIDDRVGGGGMGEVYRAQQLSMGREVAVKVLRRRFAEDEEATRRFLHEVQVVSRLTHPNTVTVYDSGKTRAGLLYIVMELLAGRLFTDAIREEAPMPADVALSLVAQVAGALAEAHDKGIVHRDLKPDNVMLAELGGWRDQVKVLDFGIALLMRAPQSSRVTRRGMVLGTPAYMAPEQAQGEETGPPADLYALGCILYECLSGRPPFVRDKPAQLMRAHVADEVPPLPDALDVPEPAEELVRWLLEKVPARRPGSARELVARIDALTKARASAMAPSGQLLSAGPMAFAETASTPATPAQPPRAISPVDPVAMEEELRFALSNLEASEAEALRSREETVGLLARLAALRGEETLRHIERVRRYCGLLARRIGLDEERCHLIEVASALHDIGKVGVPDRVLRHGDRRSKEDARLAEGHTTLGHGLLTDAGSEVLDVAATIAWTHHERYDGTGFPRGLKGRDIPMEGRICAIADVFDTLTTQRSYKPAFPADESVRILTGGRGRQFDPVLTDLFVCTVDEAMAVAHEWREPEAS